MATIKDIAEKVGVSMMTVSRAFNNPALVKKDLRLEIMETAKRMGYVPNQAAKSLANNKTGVIQIVTSIEAGDYYFTQLFMGVADCLSELGYSIMINRFKELGYQCDGMIFMGLEKNEDKHLFETIKKPFIIFGKSELSIDWIDIDNFHGMKLVTEHLIEKGHKNIAFVGINNNEAYSVERLNGYLDTMDKANLQVDINELHSVPNNIEEARAHAASILSASSATAFACESDLIAYALIESAKEMGIRIPEELSFVGFDGIMYHHMSKPSITTVVQPVYDIGRKAARMLLRRMNKPDIPQQQIIVKTSFLEGESVYVR